MNELFPIEVDDDGWAATSIYRSRHEARLSEDDVDILPPRGSWSGSSESLSRLSRLSQSPSLSPSLSPSPSLQGAPTAKSPAEYLPRLNPDAPAHYGSNNLTCFEPTSFRPVVLPINKFETAPSDRSSRLKQPGESRGQAPKGASASTRKMQYVKGSYRAATSPAAQRTYLNTILFFAASLALLCIAAVAYPVFYYNYVPKKVISIPIHLQYNSGINPYAITSLASSLTLEQAYDVSVELEVPRSPANLGRGNFMVSLFAIKSAPENPAFSFSFSGTARDPYAHVREDSVVFMSRRPTLIPYEDPLVSTTSRILFMLYHILHPGASEKTTLTVPMGELVEFKDVLPLSILVDVEAGQALQVYSATVTLVARLTGIRWAMYNHRIISFVVCTTAFWIAEMVSMGLAWLFLGYLISDRNPGGAGGTKWEDGSDYSRIDPAIPIAPYVRGGAGEEDLGVKAEDDEDVDEDVKVKDESPERETLADLPADDEEDGDDVWRETGAGTSYSHEKGGSLRRRSSRGGRA
ncbi:putative adipose-regulatory protein-domain-containing protein [Hypoxylon sp. FL1284]|nr:putative adipose-regulatory protein-domain-containing protein [Hypoxylon sp. FL1284]